MKRCVVIYNKENDFTVYLVSESNLLVHYRKELILENFLNKTDVDELIFVFKPTLHNSIIEGTTSIGTFTINDNPRACLIRDEDLDAIINLSNIFSIDDVKIVNYLDIVMERVINRSSPLIIFEWRTDMFGILELKDNKAVNFEIKHISQVSSYLSNKRRKGYCDIINADDIFDLVKCNSEITNFKKVPSHLRGYIANLCYALECSKFTVMKNSDESLSNLLDEKKKAHLNNIKNSEDKDEKEIPSRRNEITKEKEVPRLFNGEIDNLEVEKLILEKSRKPSYLKKTEGKKEKKKGIDILFASAVAIFSTIIAITFFINVVFRVEELSLKTQYNSILKTKNAIELNIKAQESAGASPASRINQIRTLSLPNTMAVDAVSFKDGVYSLNLKVLGDSTVETFKNYLPKNMEIISSDLVVDGGDTTSIFHIELKIS